MPRRGQSDHSPGDGRQPFSNEGGPEGRHAQTHDVRREELTNPKGPGPEGDEFEADIMPSTATPRLGGHAVESVPAVDDKALHAELDMLTNDELARLPVVGAGEKLQQGGVYLDLNDRERGPFKALGGQEVGGEDRFIAKRDVDYELWNRIAGEDREAEVERPVGAGE